MRAAQNERSGSSRAICTFCCWSGHCSALDKTVSGEDGSQSGVSRSDLMKRAVTAALTSVRPRESAVPKLGLGFIHDTFKRG